MLLPLIASLCLCQMVQGSRYGDPYETRKLVIPLVLVAAMLVVMLTLLLIFYFRRRQTKLCCPCLCCREFRSKHTQMLEEGCPCATAAGYTSDPFVLRKRVPETKPWTEISIVNGCVKMCSQPSISDITMTSDPCDKCTKVYTDDCPSEVLVDAPCCEPRGLVSVSSGDSGQDSGLVLSLTQVTQCGAGGPDSTEQLLSCYSSKNFDTATVGCPCVRYGKCPAKLLTKKTDT